MFDQLTLALLITACCLKIKTSNDKFLFSLIEIARYAQSQLIVCFKRANRAATKESVFVQSFKKQSVPVLICMYTATHDTNYNSIQFFLGLSYTTVITFLYSLPRTLRIED